MCRHTSSLIISNTMIRCYKMWTMYPDCFWTHIKCCAFFFFVTTICSRASCAPLWFAPSLKPNHIWIIWPRLQNLATHRRKNPADNDSTRCLLPCAHTHHGCWTNVVQRVVVGLSQGGPCCFYTSLLCRRPNRNIIDADVSSARENILPSFINCNIYRALLWFNSCRESV